VIRRFALACILSALALTGCMSTGSNYDEARVTQIQKGQTTEADLVGMFGPPTQRGIDSNGATSLQWAYTESRMSGKSFIPFAGSFLGGTDNKHKVLLVTLNQSGTVESFNSTSGGMDMRQHTQDTTANTGG